MEVVLDRLLSGAEVVQMSGGNRPRPVGDCLIVGFGLGIGIERGRGWPISGFETEHGGRIGAVLVDVIDKIFVDVLVADLSLLFRQLPSRGGSD